MGLYANDESLYMATSYQIRQLENRLAKDEQYQGFDRLYVPSQSHTTGDLNVHDVAVTFCPGFVRGLAFWKNYALVGLSKLRSKAFSGLSLENRLAAKNMVSQCGLVDTGNILHALHVGGVVEELFDVVVLPDVRQPRALGFQDDDIERLISFPDSDEMIITKLTVKRSNLSLSPQMAGLPRASHLVQSEDIVIKYQKVYHLTQENLLYYESMTNPSLQKRWKTQSQRGELFGVSARLKAR
jgi:hypothetical protein